MEDIPSPMYASVALGPAGKQKVILYIITREKDHVARDEILPD
jgi:hypothetical protein